MKRMTHGHIFGEVLFSPPWRYIRFWQATRMFQCLSNDYGNPPVNRSQRPSGFSWKIKYEMSCRGKTSTSPHVIVYPAVTCKKRQQNISLWIASLQENAGTLSRFRCQIYMPDTLHVLANFKEQLSTPFFMEIIIHGAFWQPETISSLEDLPHTDFYKILICARIKVALHRAKSSYFPRIRFWFDNFLPTL